MLALFVEDKLVTREELDATHGIVVAKQAKTAVAKQAKTAVAKQAGSKAHLKKNKNAGRRRLLVKDTTVQNLPLFKIFQEVGFNGIIMNTITDDAQAENTDSTGCKVEITKVENNILPFNKNELGCYHSKTTGEPGELTSLFQLSKEFVQQAALRDDGKETFMTKFEAKQTGGTTIYVGKVYAGGETGIRFTLKPKDQKRRRLLSSQSGSGRGTSGSAS